MAVGTEKSQIFLHVIFCIAVDMVDLKRHRVGFGVSYIPFAYEALLPILLNEVSFQMTRYIFC